MTSQPPIGVPTTAAIGITAASPSMPPIASLGDAVGEHDVQREQAGVGERERRPERLRGELDVGQQARPAPRAGAPRGCEGRAEVVKRGADEEVQVRRGRRFMTNLRLLVEPAALGLSLGVIIRIRPDPRQLADVAQLARDTPQVVECHRVTRCGLSLRPGA